MKLQHMITGRKLIQVMAMKLSSCSTHRTYMGKKELSHFNIFFLLILQICKLDDCLFGSVNF